MITIERKHPTFFAEVKGVDISKPLSPELFAEILTAFHDNAVLVFRNQPLTHQQHIDFSTNFGPLFEVTSGQRQLTYHTPFAFGKDDHRVRERVYAPPSGGWNLHCTKNKNLYIYI